MALGGCVVRGSPLKGVSFCETLEAESHDPTEPTELLTLDGASASSASVTSESPEFPEI